MITRSPDRGRFANRSHSVFCLPFSLLGTALRGSRETLRLDTTEHLHSDYTYPAKSDTNLWLRIFLITRISDYESRGLYLSSEVGHESLNAQPRELRESRVIAKFPDTLLRRDSSLVCHSERNEESREPDKRFLLSLGMTEERLSAR